MSNNKIKVTRCYCFKVQNVISLLKIIGLQVQGWIFSVLFSCMRQQEKALLFACCNKCKKVKSEVSCLWDFAGESGTKRKRNNLFLAGQKMNPTQTSMTMYLMSWNSCQFHIWCQRGWDMGWVRTMFRTEVQSTVCVCGMDPLSGVRGDQRSTETGISSNGVLITSRNTGREDV